MAQSRRSVSRLSASKVYVHLEDQGQNRRVRRGCPRHGEAQYLHTKRSTCRNGSRRQAIRSRRST